MVDWKRIALLPYPLAADYTKGVGKFTIYSLIEIYLQFYLIGNRIGELVVNSQIQLNSTEICGHSLGAHVVGFAGKYIINATRQKVKRIVGMDPAGPSFEFADSSKSLAKTDAQGVSVLHTDAKVFGIFRASGSIDFYFNGGHSIQPGCPLSNYEPNNTVLNIAITSVCSHARALYLFNESINLNNFVGTECPSEKSYNLGLCAGNQRVVLSESTPLSALGVFYLNTNAKYPYGQG